MIDNLPKDHFGKTMEVALSYLIRGESVAVYGMPGCGRIYFPKMAEIILRERQTDDLIIFINAAVLTGKIEKTLVEVISQNLNLKPTNNFQNSLGQYLANHHLVLIFSQAEEILRLQPKFFTFLDKLRNTYPNKIAILFSCDYNIISKYRQYANMGGSLFAHLIKISPFDKAGVKRILETNKHENNLIYDNKTINRITYLSGGNPALVKYIGEAIQDNSIEIVFNINQLIQYPGLNLKLNDINQLLFSENPETLTQIGVIGEKNKIFSPLLAEYFKKYEIENIDEIVPGLTKQERKILTYFLKNKGKLIDKDRLSFWMGLTNETYSLWAIYKAISRLKGKIKGKYQLKVIKDQGYKLEKV